MQMHVPYISERRKTFMTRVFDLHADLGMNIILKQEKNETRILENYHIQPMLQGEVYYCAAASFFDGSQNWKQMKEMITETRREIESSDCGWIRKPKDLDPESDKVSFIMTVEGMCGIHSNPKEKISWMYDQGVRIASLVWNETNDLATGTAGDPARGLTDKGRKVIREMNRLHMIVDVSHANEHTFWDIYNTSERPVIATHSNCRTLCEQPRNMTDEMIIATAERGGLIGMNSYRRFISADRKHQNALALAKHAKHIADIAGHQCLACGFDYLDYYRDMSKNKNDLYRADQTQNFIKALREVGFTEDQVEDIGYRNVFRFLKDNM